MSPIYPKLREAGAVFGQVMGYERPTWFDPDYASGRICFYCLIKIIQWQAPNCNKHIN
jgi:glycine cleavage system aminomethyltransferase T